MEHMRKAFLVPVLIAFLAPLLAGAVDWQMDSSPFSFGSVSIPNGGSARASFPALRCRFDFHRGIVTIRYNMPSFVKGTKISVYNVMGSLVQTFELQRSDNVIEWNVAHQGVAGGVYLAVLRHGNAEARTQLSIVK
jgi:hypothetical protein